MGRLSSVLVQKRLMILFFVITLTAGLLFLRLGYIQLWQNSFFQTKALEQRIQRIPVEGQRGTIFDRNGIPLAVSVSANAVYAIPAEVQDKESTARKIAGILHLDYEFVFQRLSKRSASEWLKKKASDEEARQIVILNLPGIGVVENSERFYPYGSVAPQVLGFVGIDNQGLEGIELYYDDFLRGKRGEVVFERDAVGREIENGVRGYAPGSRGGDIVLTIDYFIQQIAQREVERAAKETGARLGLIIISDPKTGEVLANAVYPSFDVQNFQEFPVANRKNIAVTDTYEPGSTFKAVTAAIALQEGVATINTGFFDPGYIKVSGWTIKCWNRGGHGPQSFTETMQNSCNPFYAKLGIDLGGERFYTGLTNFNLGYRMGVDFPGEAPGTVRPPSDKVPLVTWANIGFGQGLTMTPLQLLAAFGAIANEGIYSVPHYAKELITEEGVFEPNIPEQRHVISTEVADVARNVLRSAIERGSGKRADVEGYLVAGKTGTAQVVEFGRYSHSKTVTSFAGFAPYDNPTMAGLLVLWEPQGAFYGGIIAAPVFSRLTEQIMPYLGVEKRTSSPSKVRQVKVPDIGGMALSSAQSLLEERGFRVVVVGEGASIVGQVPAAEAQVDYGTLVYIYTDFDYIDAALEIPNPIGA